MLGCIGDLVEDIGVRLGGPINIASDTDVVVRRRRGGSAANVAVAAAAISGKARFIGTVGDDALGKSLKNVLHQAGVEVAGNRAGRSGTIVVLVDDQGERTMLTDRGSSADLADPEPEWLDGLTGLHVPFYSLISEPRASTCRTLIGWAHDRDIMVSIDLSSTAVLADFGLDELRALLAELRPAVVFANEDEAELTGVEATLAMLEGHGGVLVVHGPHRAIVHSSSGQLEVDAHDLGAIEDTTGAGDAFAAGYLSACLVGAASIEAAKRAHDSARDHLS